MPNRTARLILVAVALLAPAVVRAETPASAAFHEGIARMKAKDYNGAIVQFQRAAAAGGERLVLYDLGEAHRLAGHPERALDYYRQFLAAAPMSPLRFSVKAHMRELAALVEKQAAARRLAGRRRAPAKAPVAPNSVESAPAPEPAPVAAAAPATAPPVIGQASAGGEAGPGGEAGVGGSKPEAPAAEASPPSAAETLAPPPEAPAPADAPSPAPAPSVVPAPVAAAAPAEPLPEAPRPARRLESGGTASILVGAVLLGGGIGFGAAALERASEVDQSVRFDPQTENQGQAFQVASVALSVVGLVAIAVGAELFRQHADQAAAYRRAHPNPPSASRLSRTLSSLRAGLSW